MSTVPAQAELLPGRAQIKESPPCLWLLLPNCCPPTQHISAHGPVEIINWQSAILMLKGAFRLREFKTQQATG
jgi:hypothetical protein